MPTFKCLCCGQDVSERGNPVTPERALRSYLVLTGQGYTPEDLTTVHRENLEFCAPGFVQWIEDHTLAGHA
jgi:hypothetical protein